LHILFSLENDLSHALTQLLAQIENDFFYLHQCGLFPTLLLIEQSIYDDLCLHHQVAFMRSRVCFISLLLV